MRELLIATRNEGKMPEIRRGLEGLPFTIVDVNDVSALEGFEPEESGSTFEENAIIKAKEYGAQASMLTLADDSGLEVDALHGGPGIKSARYAPGSDADRNKKLLAAMADVTDEKRGARFVSVIAIYDPATGTVRTCESISIGRIAHESQGTRPFGYDPIFLYDEAGKTGGQMTVEEKNTYSHRGKALAKAREILLAEFAESSIIRS